ncbi:uncharacterized protein TNCV_1548721 [Trichonephila clavipes]|nr:uncharacterized protein TNCV_1548721 [Trichonephila clavipes]
MAFGGFLPQINHGVQGVTQGGHHSGAQRVNPEFRVGSNFRIIPEQYFSGVENVQEFLENTDNNLTYYEIPTQLVCAYLKGYLTGRALDWFEVLGYRVVEDKVTDYAHLKQTLSEQFPVLEPQILDYVEVRNPQTTSNLLQIIDKYEERFLNRKIRGSSWKSRDIKPNENNRFPNRNRQKIGGKREVTIDMRTILDHGDSSIDLRVKVLWIIRDSMVDAEVINRIIDSTIKAVDRVVRGIVLSGVRMIETDI